MAARKAEKLGYTNVKVFHAGLPAWIEAGHPVVSNLANLENLNKLDASYILIDLRSKAQIKGGHIAKAVAAADGKVEALKDQFPKYKSASIILYNQDGNIEKAMPAYKAILGWGYKRVSILDGGIQAWQKAGKELAKGPAASKITYVRKLLPGEIDQDKFKQLVANAGDKFVIVDVRTLDEFHGCGLPGSMSVPLDDIESKLGELPKDKTPVMYCNTGVRAEMAYHILKKAGVEAKFLKAVTKLERDKDGKCVATVE